MARAEGGGDIDPIRLNDCSTGRDRQGNRRIDPYRGVLSVFIDQRVVIDAFTAESPYVAFLVGGWINTGEALSIDQKRIHLIKADRHILSRVAAAVVALVLDRQTGILSVALLSAE